MIETICSEFKAKLQEITELSAKINKNDNEKILDMMTDHIIEIKERYHNQDEHWTNMIKSGNLSALKMVLKLRDCSGYNFNNYLLFSQYDSRIVRKHNV